MKTDLILEVKNKNYFPKLSGQVPLICKLCYSNIVHILLFSVCVCFVFVSRFVSISVLLSIEFLQICCISLCFSFSYSLMTLWTDSSVSSYIRWVNLCWVYETTNPMSTTYAPQSKKAVSTYLKYSRYIDLMSTCLSIHFHTKRLYLHRFPILDTSFSYGRVLIIC